MLGTSEVNRDLGSGIKRLLYPYEFVEGSVIWIPGDDLCDLGFKFQGNTELLY
jgi:hypothetical protein